MAVYTKLKKGDIKTLKSTIESLRLCTQPIDGHDDPASISDCWNTVEEIVSCMESNLKELQESNEKKEECLINAVNKTNALFDRSESY